MKPMHGTSNAGALAQVVGNALPRQRFGGCRLICPRRGGRNGKPIHIVAFGDSLSAGYGLRRAIRFRPSCRRS